MSEAEPNDTTALEHWSFLLILATVSVLLVWVTWPFVGPLMWATLAAIMFQPLYKWSLIKTRGRRNPAAALSLVIIFVAVLLPALWLGSVVVNEAIKLINELQANPIDVRAVIDDVYAMLPEPVQRFAADNGFSNFATIQDRLQEILGESAGIIASEAISIGSGALGFFLSFAIGLYVLFFLLRDGSRIGETLVHSAPLDREIAERLAERFLGIVRAVIKGSGVVGVVQGTIGGIVLAIAGVPSSLLLGVMMAILALIPAVGTALVWVPAGIWLIVIGEVWQGVFVLGAGAIIISSVDNVLRPILVGRDTGIPDWIILVTTLGGISLAGFSGIVLGPLVAGMFLASWSILQELRAEDEESLERYRMRVGVDGRARSDEELEQLERLSDSEAAKALQTQDG
ncbi:AI-2E family transporter [Erythrobacter sp. SCSIO 43205]|uniref:AI-2E family transporter n=1 Tax=Erythrobacter sp. SCSIO 43205 TaxID=2779361 RepID=UPI001CA83139|nr:AI-2E family transporter [Erythrobacter sp. SCSIO 43205]UAB78655.1 AI-2E family transporter [Erythrobacter sp. SCSIO 43205]